jgi:ribosomal protein S21
VRARRVRSLEEHVVPDGILRSRHGVHALVVVRDGDVELALKELRHQRDASGLTRLLRHHSPLYGYYSPGETRRAKSGRHRANVRKQELKRRLWEEHREEQRAMARRKYGEVMRAAA